jgi:hypothetical protein
VSLVKMNVVKRLSTEVVNTSLFLVQIHMVFMVVCGDPSCPLAALSNEDLMSPPLFTLSCIVGPVDPAVYYSITCLSAGHLLLDYLLPKCQNTSTDTDNVSTHFLCGTPLNTTIVS